MRREVVVESPEHPRSRLDFRLSNGSRPDVWIEVKNVTLWDGERIRFPDAITARSRKHLDLLAVLRERGYRSVILFAVNRPEGNVFSPAWSVDPGYAQRLQEVIALGVEAVAVRIAHSKNQMHVSGAVEIDLDAQ